MPSEHTLIFISSILELLVLLFVAYEVIVGEIRHRRAGKEHVKDDNAPPPTRRRRMSLRLGSFIAFISLAIWLVIYGIYGNGTFLSFNGREPDTGPIVWNLSRPLPVVAGFSICKNCPVSLRCASYHLVPRERTELTNQFEI
jgi:hypothetical protein